jgi:uncharacterized protein (TIGR03435 family)
MKQLIVAASLTVGFGPVITVVTAQETYEAASIKATAVRDVADVLPARFLANGQWSARGATLSILLRSAYDVAADRIVGLPPWARTQRFDIVTSR